MSIPDIAERVSVDGSRPASRRAASSSANLATAPSGLVDERLNSSAYFAAIRNARGLPWLPVIRFGRPPLRPGSVPGLGRNSESCTAKCLPMNDQPSGSSHRPCRISRVSSSISARSAISGNGKPWRLCSSSCQPAPTPTSTRPPLISSTVSTTLARLPGYRYVTGDTSTPRPIRVVSRARPARTVHASVVGLPSSPGKLS